MPTDPRPELSHPQLDDVPLAAALHALADPTRLKIVETLRHDAEGRACGTFPVNVAPSTLSHHLKVLRQAGLIRQQERGNRRWTYLRGDEVEARFPGLLDVVTQEAHRKEDNA